jgi:DNA modification methylase
MSAAPYYNDGDVTLHHGDALAIARSLPSGSVQTIVTSPPYFGLRDYGEDGQIGAEETPAEYVANLVALFHELRRVLVDHGTAWINLGDSYASSPRGNKPGDLSTSGLTNPKRQDAIPRAAAPKFGLPAKNLLGIPWRVAFGLQDDGWILRSDIIWAKRNLMPEAVTDRPTKAHEYLFLLTKRPSYYYDADAIREDSTPEQEEHNARYAKEYEAHTTRAATSGQPGNVNNIGIHSRPGKGGRNKRSVWTVSAQPFAGAHFAVYPPELIRPCILAGSRPGDTVLDPFSGSGTTGMVANYEGRKYVGIDLNSDYLDLSLRTRFSSPALNIPGWEDVS